MPKKIIFKNPVLMGFLVFLFVLLLTQYLTYQHSHLLQMKENIEVAKHAVEIENKLENILSQSFSSTATLGFIVENYGVPKDFDSIARILLSSNKHVDALELVNSTGEITHVYPLETNQVIGFNILQDSIGKTGAFTAIERKGFFTAGPIPLKQGGEGFVSRVPIFREDSFLGFAAAIVKLPSLMNSIRLDSIQNGHFSYQLSKINKDNSEEIFFRSKKFERHKGYVHSITMNNAEWNLKVVSNKNIDYSTVALYSILGLLFSLLCGFIMWQFIRLPQYLSRVLHKKTKLLRESKYKFKTLVEQATDGIFLTSAEGLVLEVNLKGAEMLGYTINELIGLNLTDIYDKEDIIANPIKFKELENGRPIIHERLMVRKNGTRFYAEITAKMLDNGNLLGIGRDVTERKEAREILEEKNKELEKTNAELNQFVYSASHELRAPLSSVLGLLEIIKLEENEPQLIEKLDMMDMAIKNLDGFISDIIQYSRNRHVEVEGELIDFNSLVQESLASLWYLKNRNKIAIEVSVEDTVPFISDRKRVSVLLNNFISNAIKYHNLDGNAPYIDITIKTNADYATMEIKDNGPGIEKEHLDKIFNMFYRVPSRITGSGIGLFIVKEVLNKLKGDVTIESEPNQGTVFFVTIPNQKL
ncbi:ATP-binding protein [Maribacter sp. X9]|uniref:ATP-binding protein n=1 Tax=Maribacter sp. X9 TaxID=3402159 RepID=UPI003AF3C966